MCSPIASIIDAPQPESTPEPSTAELLARYATSFQRQHASEDLQFKRVDNTSGDVMTTYIVYYTSRSPKYRLDEVTSDGDSAYISNSQKMEAWSQLFCTQELRSILIDRDINLVMGQVLTPGMRDNDPSKLNAQCGK